MSREGEAKFPNVRGIRWGWLVDRCRRCREILDGGLSFVSRFGIEDGVGVVGLVKTSSVED